MTDQEFDLLREQEEKRREQCRDLVKQYPWLANEIAAISEQAYRRGYQQGAYRKADDGEIADWRYKPFGDKSRYYTATTPPNCTSPSIPAIKRLQMEARNVSLEVSEIVDETLRMEKQSGES